MISILSFAKKESTSHAKYYLHKGHVPTDNEIRTKVTIENTLLLDESGSATGKRLALIGTGIKGIDLHRFRKVTDVFPSRKDGKEVKYNNTTEPERTKIIEKILDVDTEIYDATYNVLPIGKELFSEVERLCGKNFESDEENGFYKARYIYMVYQTVESAINTHTGRFYVMLDASPLEIADDIERMFQKMWEDDHRVEWFLYAPSRHVVELQVHDFVTGFQNDINKGKFNSSTDRKVIEHVTKFIQRRKNP